MNATPADYHDAWLMALMSMRWSRLLLTMAVFPGALGTALMATTSSDISQPNNSND